MTPQQQFGQLLAHTLSQIVGQFLRQAGLGPLANLIEPLFNQMFGLQGLAGQAGFGTTPTSLEAGQGNMGPQYDPSRSYSGSYGGGLQPVPPQISERNLQVDRQRYAQELQNNPGLRDKILHIAYNEQGANPQGTQAIIESMMNRASARGTTLAQQAGWHGIDRGGYYDPRNRFALDRSPQSRGVLEQSLRNALGGGNVSNYATDNSSGSLAARERRTGTFRATGQPIHGESFFTPGSAERGLIPGYQRWRAGLGGQGQPPADVGRRNIDPIRNYRGWREHLRRNYPDFADVFMG
jgi:hypothetical protein